MMAADATIALKEPILLAIKQVRGCDCLPIEMFNDHPLTTHSLVVKVLRQAREKALRRMASNPRLARMRAILTRLVGV
ncbi:MAG TPA: hypothetical protein VGU20_02205 [Stellaceae bacterium]|nr:hypothetical protein [Stellaceae bacterium]